MTWVILIAGKYLSTITDHMEIAQNRAKFNDLGINQR